MAFKLSSILVILVLLAQAASLPAEPAPDPGFRIGFFEGGPYPAHADFRNHFREQLGAMIPSGREAVYVPEGFKSAQWDREKSRGMARELAAADRIDLVVAIGPWSVEDLLEAGFKRPIIAVMRFDPVAEGLADEQGRPLFDNLTVRIRPGKLESDLRYLAELIPIDRLGVLCFPSGNEAATVVDRAGALGRQLGFEVTTAEGFDRNGTYAFFKAYRAIAGDVDALYLSPLWGFDSEKTRQFYSMVDRDGVATLSSEDSYHVTRGALAAGSVESTLERAHYHAFKAVQIIKGATPADLPTRWTDSYGLTVNDLVARQLEIKVPSDRRYDVRHVEATPPDNLERLTVIDAVALALTQSPDYQARQAVFEAAGSLASESRSAYLPHLSLRGSAVHFDNNSVNNDDRFTNNRYRVGLTLSQELFSPGTISDIQKATHRRALAGVDLRQAGLDLELAVTEAFLNVYQADQVRLVETTHQAQVNQCYRLARLRLALREAEAAEVWRWEAENLRAIASRQRAESNLAVARILLNTLLGRPGDYDFAADWQHFTDARFFAEESFLRQLTPTGTDRNRLMAFFTEAASASPRLVAADRQVGVGRTNLAGNAAAFYPRVGFFGSLDLTDELAERPGFSEEWPTWSVGVGLELPLFLGGERFRARDRLRAELSGLEFQRDRESLGLASDIRVAVECLLSRAEEFPLAARAAELANQYYPQVSAQYASGQATLPQLLDAAQNDRRASLEAIIIQIEYYRAVAGLLHAAGISPNSNNRSPGEELISRVSVLLSGGG